MRTPLAKFVMLAVELSCMPCCWAVRDLALRASFRRPYSSRKCGCMILNSLMGPKYFSKQSTLDISHEFDDDHPETKEVLHDLRARYHYHGIAAKKPKTHQVFVVEPDFKWGTNRFHRATTQHRLDEACGLIESLNNWKVAERSLEPVRKLDGKRFFGKGKIEALSERVKLLQEVESNPVDAVFLDVARLTPRQQRGLEELWSLKVFDRFAIVLQIFKERAKSGEAKLQVELAELPYIRSLMVHEEGIDFDQQSGGTHYIGGAGETQMEKDRRVLLEREQKLQKKLQNLKKQRDHVRQDRKKRHVPTVAVVGYTNAGKTTLIKNLTGESKMHPEDKLFATLDVTAHPGKLSSGLTALFVDTIGFVSDLPPELVDSFSATLEDVASADLIIHVRDISHPESEAQRDDVYEVLKKLALKPFLMDNIIEVLNKIDLCHRTGAGVVSENPGIKASVRLSALQKTGIDELKEMVEQGVMMATGRQVRTLVLPNDGPQLSWLYHQAMVQETGVDDRGNLVATVIMDEATNAKYRAKFGREAAEP